MQNLLSFVPFIAPSYIHAYLPLSLHTDKMWSSQVQNRPSFVPFIGSLVYSCIPTPMNQYSLPLMKHEYETRFYYNLENLVTFIHP